MKKNRFKYPIIFLVVIIVSYFLNTSYYFYDIVRGLSEFTFWMSFSAFIASLIAVFIKDSAYFPWKKFTNYFLLVSVILILITPTSGNSGGSLGMDLYAIDKELVTIVLSILYASISLPLIIYKSLKNN